MEKRLTLSERRYFELHCRCIDYGFIEETVDKFPDEQSFYHLLLKVKECRDLLLLKLIVSDITKILLKEMNEEKKIRFKKAYFMHLYNTLKIIYIYSSSNNELQEIKNVINTFSTPAESAILLEQFLQLRNDYLTAEYGYLTNTISLD